MPVNKAYDVYLNPYTKFQADPTSVLGIQKDIITIPANRNFQFFFLELINITPAQIVNMVFRANNSIFQQWVSGTDLDLQNQREGLPAAAAATSGNPILTISQRRDRLFGGALQYLTPPGKNATLPVGLMTGSPKDLETNTSLNCGVESAPGAGDAINTLSLELWLNMAGSAATPRINVQAYAYDPFPGGPGLMKFVDTKLVTVSSGNPFTFNKDTAFTMGDGQRLNLDQVLVMNPSNHSIDNLQHYWQSQILRNRNTNINAFMALLNTLKQDTGLIYPLFDSREMLYGDETWDISNLSSAVSMQATFGTSGGYQIYQISTGKLLPGQPQAVPTTQASS